MMKDNLINKFLNVRARVLTTVNPRYIGTDEPDTSRMKVVLTDYFRVFDKFKWRIGQPWGIMHPGAQHQYYGEQSVTTTEYGLILSHQYSPEYKSHYSLESPVLVPYSVGLISSIDSYRYGFFQFNISLPFGIGLWPAVWLTSATTWPPEIDILEAYTDSMGLYKNRFETNIHYNLYPNNVDLGAQRHPLELHDITVSCWWTKDFIKIYYNGILVRQVTDKKILKWFENQRMIIVLNNGLQREHVDKQIQLKDIKLSKFIIHSVQIWQ
jgi:beta-glucanase (GH16 family)